MASQPFDSIGVRQHNGFAKRISSHIAYALVAYTLALIFMVAPQMESKGMAIWPYFVLVFLVGAAILPCRNLERRWQLIDANGQGSDRQFRREMIGLWLCAVGFPTLLMIILWVIP